MAKKRRGEDPVARLQERARWSSFTNVWNGSAAPGGAPHWVRRMIIAAFVVMAVVGLVVGLVGLLTHYW
jgi:TRAP-type mannitol/chloroaromatic compound transport system permease small subunit